MANTAKFPCLTSTFEREGDLDVVTVSFDSLSSLGIMEFFASAKRGRRGLVSIGISPIHKPQELILRLTGEEKPRPRLPGGIGYAFDQIGPDGKPMPGLVPTDAYTSFDGGNDNHWTPLNTTAQAKSVSVVVDTDGHGHPVISLICAFPKAQVNA